MSVIGLHGIPGTGKSVSGVSVALRHYKKENSILKQFIRYLKKESILINNVYSNFPILLDKKHNIYSNIINIDDLDNTYSFKYNSIIILDEVQAFYDSYRDFKKFPVGISSFFQMHRHFGVKDIYVISQHPRRIITYIRDVISQYHRIKHFYKLRLLNLGIICYRKCYEFEDFTESFTRDKERKKILDIKTGFYIFKLSKVFKAFDSKYLKVLNFYKPLPDYGTYSNKEIPKSMVDYLNKKLFE